MEALFTIPKEQIDLINLRLQKIENLLTQTQEPFSDWLSAKEAQSLLGVGQTTLWQYRKEGLIMAYKNKKKLFFKRSELIAFLESGNIKK